MITQQHHTGNSNNATATDSTANGAAQTGSLPEGLHWSFYESTDDALKRLLAQKVQEFFSDYCTPIETVNFLLKHWLTSSQVDLSVQGNKSRLDEALALVNFLEVIRSDSDSIDIPRD